ncbi:MAG: glutathione S-transferase [Alphaproteobacteria bacterium]|nr:glutathione S-transferase [Alphaproteobacteria bacterium]
MRKLFVFGISHFCEKAKWALDWHGVDYDEINWPPGPHLLLAKRLGAPRSSVPILRSGEQLVQGSDHIIDWADALAPDSAKNLSTPEARALEQRADRSLGIHTRRLAYAECLKTHPHVVKPALFHNLSMPHLLLANIMWPITRRAMIRGYELGEGAAAESRARVETELDWLDGVIADGRPFLAGDKFTRADIAVASLLSPFARPDAMPLYQRMEFPPNLAADLARWQSRPILQWVADIYAHHRTR